MKSRRTRRLRRRPASAMRKAPSPKELVAAYEMVRDADRQWREEWRGLELRVLAELTENLEWSPALFLAVLQELAVGDEFKQILGDPSSIPPSRYPQAIAVAIALKQRWYPGSLDDFVASLDVGSAPPRKRAPTSKSK